MYRCAIWLMAVAGMTFFAPGVFAQDASTTQSTVRFGGPDAVENVLDEQSETWSDWQKSLAFAVILTRVWAALIQSAKS